MTVLCKCIFLLINSIYSLIKRDKTKPEFLEQILSKGVRVHSTRFQDLLGVLQLARQLLEGTKQQHLLRAGRGVERPVCVQCWFPGSLPTAHTSASCFQTPAVRESASLIGCFRCYSEQVSFFSPKELF